ncbi:MAG TPA: DUF58 domain-containing protein [Candidatus Agrococcus pullicola]|uniref:DUF58 domain-containing protein n=1 Tax=Candidatus Agrococcus pullicola TaxID=2838429 RepID=A0A9D1YWH5_9MICO|nr:DUF58 domain-containing protein [Candidatus Agrococcus pullicola]
MPEADRDTGSATRSRFLTMVRQTQARFSGDTRESELRANDAPTLRERASALWRRWSSLIAPYLEPVTGLGWLALAVGVSATVFGLIFGWREVIVAGLAALALLAIAVLFVLGRTQYRIELDLAYTRVVVGERALGRIEIHAASNRSLPPAAIEVPVGDAVATFDLPRMAPGDVHEDIFAIPTRRRAVLQVGPVRSVRADPLGLLRRQVRWTDPVELFVHPKTVHLDATSVGLIRDLEGISSRELTDSDISFHALREYAPGDDRRYIHWKSTARTGKLMVRQFEQTKRSILALGLSTNAHDYVDPEEFEVSISVLGSLGLQAIRDEMNVSVVTSKTPVSTIHPKRMLDALSRLDYGSRHANFLQLAAKIGREHTDASLIVLHAGTGVSADDIRRAKLLLPPQARAVVVQANPEAGVSIRELGGAQLLVIDEVESLPRLLRAVSEA